MLLIALKHYRSISRIVRGVATSAMRSAQNGKDLVTAIIDQTIEIEVISGDREAELILGKSRFKLAMNSV